MARDGHSDGRLAGGIAQRGGAEGRHAFSWSRDGKKLLADAGRFRIEATASFLQMENIGRHQCCGRPDEI